MQAAVYGELDARGLANLAYGATGVWKSVGVGKSVCFRKSPDEMFAAISKGAKRHLDQFNA